ncbi:MAG: hypothetical protein HOO91_11195 [Bacteroidales bacterium]|nr:hypothetical protein [Bacteroidales bacterium]
MINKIFSEVNSNLYPLISNIITLSDEREYLFTSEEEFIKILHNNIVEANKIYWVEILNRVHSAAFLSLIRNIRWLDSMILNYDNNNFIGFCSSTRGLLESSVDSYDTFIKVPISISKSFSSIKKSLHCEQKDTVYLDSELEETLIHFTYARRLLKNENSPKCHETKSIKKYIEFVDEEENGSLYQFYSFLCQISHPAAFSVLAYLKQKQYPTYDICKISPNTDSLNIKNLINLNSENLNAIFEAGLFSSLICLKLLNEFNIREYYTKEVNFINFEDSEMWKEVIDNINTQRTTCG